MVKEEKATGHKKEHYDKTKKSKGLFKGIIRVNITEYWFLPKRINLVIVELASRLHGNQT